MIGIGNMLWRIGELLDIDKQLAWTRDAGFEGVSVHASAGNPSQWRGIEPGDCSLTERKRLRQEIERFSFSEIHAPFAITLRRDNLASAITSLTPILQFAQDLGVGVVTVHAEFSGSGTELDLTGWLGPMQELNAEAAQAKTKVALEINEGFDVVMSWGLPNVAVNLDVGHMYLPEQQGLLEAACMTAGHRREHLVGGAGDYRGRRRRAGAHAGPQKGEEQPDGGGEQGQGQPARQIHGVEEQHRSPHERPEAEGLDQLCVGHHRVARHEAVVAGVGIQPEDVLGRVVSRDVLPRDGRSEGQPEEHHAPEQQEARDPRGGAA